MKQSIIHIALLVRDYDEALDFYLQKLGFDLVEDTRLSETKRWVLIKPPGSSGCCLLLAKAADEQQWSAVGNQSGGRVFLFLETENFDESYQSMLANGISFVREPIVESYGTVAVFKDLYGNLWDLIEKTVDTV
ncbi:VOC family protein [Chryseobacterium camelliae]|uniref:VOC family protein n=1 Tax=Chryseobacterium camelliae TaxID=1265445 RepID=UPI002856D556|nr:VOC family protein [Chryseobacterium camelliae]MDR6513842.1 catechol 2,3-dioxygenase-like lactoylglutathione lyase family enzyme [Chryseobacterium camelliae]